MDTNRINEKSKIFWAVLIGLLILPIPFFYFGYVFEKQHFLWGYVNSFPYFLEYQGSPHAYRPLMPLVVTTTAQIISCDVVGKVDVVDIGYGILILGFYISCYLLYTLLKQLVSPGYRLLGLALFIIHPYLLTLPWGQIQGNWITGILPAWHFSNYTEGITLPLSVFFVMMLRHEHASKDAVICKRHIVYAIILVIFLFTKEVLAFYFLLVWWQSTSNPQTKLRILLIAIACLVLYVAFRWVLIGDHPPTDAPLWIWGDFPKRFLENGYPILFLPFIYWGGWLIVFWKNPDPWWDKQRVSVIVYGIAHGMFSCFWEPRLYLALAPLIIPMLVITLYTNRRI